MTDRELREIRRRFRPDKTNILSIKGCIVNSENKIISRFNQPVMNCTTEESEKLLGAMKKSLSGGVGTNLMDLEFPTAAVGNSEEHKLLMALRQSGLKDEGALEYFYSKVISSVKFEGNYAILLAYDNYDVFTFTKDGEKEESGTVFSYIVCSICPVKPLNTGLYYRESDCSFRDVDPFAILNAPEVGFMFPTFDDRAANIYNVLYYSKDIADIHPAFVGNIFGVELPMSAAQKKDTFGGCLKETLEEECDFETLRSVHDQIAEMEKEHKDQKQQEPLRLSKASLKGVLEYCGIGKDKVERFGQRFDEQFGQGAEVAPKSIVDTKKFKVETPDVSIKVNPERTDLVSTQVINGIKYILIQAGEGVEVNGVNIDIH